MRMTYVALCGWAAKADDSIVCFGAKPDKGFLDMKSRRIRKWKGEAREAVDDATQQRAVGGWTAERAVGGWTSESQAAESWRLDSREARQHGIGSSESESR